MSGGPPHHPPARPAPPSAPAWNHLQVPNYFPSRQPQHAHMSNEPTMLHQPTWHTPTTEPLKTIPHSHIYSLEQMLSGGQFPRHSQPGVDLTLTRNGGSQNGEHAPISLSVRDTNRINSLPASALDIQAVESPMLKSVSPILKSSPSEAKNKSKRVDSIVERLAPLKTDEGAPPPDENSNSSGVPTAPVEEASEDSLDSNKSRRKRKPSKTLRVAKESAPIVVIPEISTGASPPEKKIPERRRSSDDAVTISEVPAKTRRKTSSESETIDNIAAMVQELKAKPEPPSEPPQPSNTQQFVEVENKLEEMFAGIDEEQPPEAPSTSQDNVTSTSGEIVKKSPKKNKRKHATPKKKPPKVKTAKTSGKTPKSKKKLETTIKDVYAYDSGSNASSSKSRGPFIQIRGTRESPLSVSVVNTPTNDDEDKKSKTKKFHDDSEYRHKVRSKGLHCSTLSHQYDAQTKDASWICAFCKRGPHATELTGPSVGAGPPAGDLFGPYFITTNSAEFERRLDDPFDKGFKSKKIVKCLEVAKATTGKRARRKGSLDEDSWLGVHDTGSGTFEVWAHQDCIVWSPGIYLIGPKIVGLEEAVWTSCNVACGRCHLKGANICCLKRGCVQVVHLCCARLEDWVFDEGSFKTYCPEHGG